MAALHDITGRERAILFALAVPVLLLGVWPAPLLDMMHSSVEQLVAHIAQSKIPM